MTTYTIHLDGKDAISGLSVADAAGEILTADGQEFKIFRDEPDCWRLWQRQEVANVRWHALSIWSFEETEDAAEADIFQQVINRCLEGRWDRYTEIMTDDAYNAMVAQLAADEAA